ncbi:MAG: hypothetical protein EHM42_13790 [Planctomycetaceae bacterium]|nr:MAG: hypothetical protein EHM42_13790 [Planctomycetaceae bacterium]
MHLRYKPDDTAQGVAVNAARLKYPAANLAAEPLVIYPLNRPGAPGLPPEFARQEPAAGQPPRPAARAVDAAALRPRTEPTTGDSL